MLSCRSAALQADSTFACTHLGSVPIQHQFSLQQWVAAMATSLATPTISDAGTVRLVEQVRGSKIVDGGHGTIWIIRISVDRVALAA